MGIQVVINYTYGGFNLPAPMVRRLNAEGLECDAYSMLGGNPKDRADPRLIAAVLDSPEMTPDLAVVTLPEGHVHWIIEEYDGKEHVVSSATPLAITGR